MIARADRPRGEGIIIPDLLTAKIEALRLARKETDYEEGYDGPKTSSPWDLIGTRSTEPAGHYDDTAIDDDDDDDDEWIFAGSKSRHETGSNEPIYAYKVEPFDSMNTSCPATMRRVLPPLHLLAFSPRTCPTTAYHTAADRRCRREIAPPVVRAIVVIRRGQHPASPVFTR
jgi:hypothetical protein